MFPLFTLSTACSSLSIWLPNAHVEHPQVSQKGDLGWEVLKTGRGNLFKVSSDASLRPPVWNDVHDLHLHNLSNLMSSFNYGFAENFDFGLLLGAQSGIKLKYQFPETQFALFTSYEQVTSSIKGDYNGHWAARAENNNWNLGFSFGSQFTERSYGYFGAAYSDFKIKSDIEQDAYGPTSPAAKYSKEKSGNSSTLTTGLLLGKKDSQLELTLNHSVLKFDSNVNSDNYLGISYSTAFIDIFNQRPREYVFIPKPLWQDRDFGGLILSYFVGFGTGQAAQGNWKSKGRIFFISDCSGLTLMLFSTQNVLEQSAKPATGLYIYAISRLWQMIDVIIDGSSGTRKEPKIREKVAFND